MMTFTGVDNSFFNILLGLLLLSAIPTAVALLFIPSPYGRYSESGQTWGPQINPRLGWFIMESPASLVFLYFYVTGTRPWVLPSLLLLLMWQTHYAHRAFIYPFQMRVRPGNQMPLLVALLGALFCTVNGYLNSIFIVNYAPHLAQQSWLSDPRFIIGVGLFLTGYYINKRSDHILQSLRRDNPDGYRIPHGFLFKWVSMPNYFGEIITWLGFAIAAWSPAGLAFVIFTIANLVPRALSHHRWYQAHFADYPSQRKAIFPLIL